MTADISSADVDSMTDTWGRTITLRRLGDSPYAEVFPKAIVRRYRPDEFVGMIVQGDQEVRISNTAIAAGAWPGPPARGDQVVIGGKTATVQSCDARYVGEEPVLHVMQVRGA
jgi:hypothetical protein